MLHSLRTGYCGEHFDRYPNRPFPSSLTQVCLCFKTCLSAKPIIWKWILQAVSFSCKSESHFHNNGFVFKHNDARTANKNAASFGVGFVNNPISPRPPNRKTRKQTRFETKAKGNPKMAYSSISRLVHSPILFSLLTGSLFALFLL